MRRQVALSVRRAIRPIADHAECMGDLARLLKESWTLVEEQQDKLAGYFYARMFLSHPGPAGPVPGADGRPAVPAARAIVTAVQTLDDPERFDEYLRALGRDHRKFHVRTGALRGGRRRADRGAAAVSPASSWSLEYDQAWRDAYAVIAAKMLAGAEADTQPAVLARRGGHPRAARPATSRSSPAAVCSRWSSGPGSTSASSAALPAAAVADVLDRPTRRAGTTRWSSTSARSAPAGCPARWSAGCRPAT